MTYQLGYWNIRGFIEPIHLVMEYLGLPYETKRYEYDAMNEWFEEDKPKLGADFPNIPYLKNGDFVLCQSVAILKYLGRKGGLYPALESPEEMAQLEALIDTVLDVRMGFAFLCYGDGFETKKIDFMDRVPKKLASFDKRLSTRKWLNGENLFIGDFQFWSTLDFMECMEPKMYENLPNLVRYKKDFEAIPQVAKYLASDKFKKFPINGKIAAWGGNAE